MTIKLPILLCLLTFAHFSAGAEIKISHGGVILQYHHVSDRTPSITSISAELFSQHLDYIDEHNFQVWPLEKLISALKHAEKIPDKVLSITFDDAYADIYENALPLLREKNFPFTVFIATKLVGRRTYLNWQQIQEMSLQGMSVANHTHSHAHLLRMQKGEDQAGWEARIRQDILQAESLIASNVTPNKPTLNKYSKLFAYPYGEYNNELLKIVADLGYTGFGQQSGAVGPQSSFLVLPRYPLSGIYSQLAPFKTKMMSIAMPLQRSASAELMINPLLEPGSFRPSLELNFSASSFRLNQLACYGPNGAIKIKKINDTRYRVSSGIDLPIGRSRYNCTMPVKRGQLAMSPPEQAQRYHWFSQIWIRKEDDGSWYLEK